MELGMSRTGAIEVFELMMNDNMNKTETLAWLRSSDPAVLINLPELVKQENRSCADALFACDLRKKANCAVDLLLQGNQRNMSQR